MQGNTNTVEYMGRFCFPPNQDLGKISKLYNPKIKLNFAELSKIFESKEVQKGLIKTILVSTFMSLFVSIILNKFAGTLIITVILTFFASLAAAAYFIYSRIMVLEKEMREFDMSGYDKDRIKAVKGQLWIILYVIGGFSVISSLVLICLRKRISMSANMIKVILIYDNFF